MAHGSKNANWLLPFQQLGDDLTKDLGKERVRLCFMELAAPLLEDVVEQLHREGKKHVRLLPLFLASGSHLNHDVPEQLAKLKAQFPDLTIEQLPPIGDNPKFAELLRILIKQMASRTP
jgi:sirohydrochlorin cobaltochelatase